MPYLGGRTCGWQGLVWIGEQGCGRGSRSLSMRRATPVYKTLPPCHVLFALLLDWAKIHWRRLWSDHPMGWLASPAVCRSRLLHHPVVVKAVRHPNELPEFRWLTRCSANLKTSFQRSFHALRFKSTLIATWAPFSYRFRSGSIWRQMTSVWSCILQLLQAPAERLPRSAEFAYLIDRVMRCSRGATGGPVGG